MHSRASSCLSQQEKCKIYAFKVNNKYTKIKGLFKTLTILTKSSIIDLEISQQEYSFTKKNINKKLNIVILRSKRLLNFRFHLPEAIFKENLVVFLLGLSFIPLILLFIIDVCQGSKYATQDGVFFSYVFFFTQNGVFFSIFLFLCSQAAVHAN